MKVVEFCATKKDGARTHKLIIDSYDKLTIEQATDFIFDDSSRVRPWRRIMQSIQDNHNLDATYVHEKQEVAACLERDGWTIEFTIH